MRLLLGLILALCVGTAEAKPRGAANNVPQIFYNIVTDAGAACNGDSQTITRTVTTVASPSPANKNLNVSVNTFSSGDVGKYIKIPGAGVAGATLQTTIQTFVDAQNVTLTLAASTALSGVSTALTYGADDAPKFVAFNTWARANQGVSNQVVLTIPNGANCWFGSGNAISGTTIQNAFASGINNLIIEGTGATLNSTNGFGFTLGGVGICSKGLTDAAGCSARLQSVSAGATQVTLTAASLAAGYISRFAVNGWVMLGGLNTQALWNSPFGEPANLNYFEWRQVTAINAGTGVITLDRSLTNSYLDTWPLYNSGNAFQPDAGGPASIFAVGDSWNTIQEIRGLTITQDGQTYARGRNITYRNVTFSGSNGAIPTQNESWSVINCVMTLMNMETDKLVGTMLMDGVTIKEIKFQSSSTNLFIIRNSTVTLDLTGSAKNNELTDVTLAAWVPGAYAYGATTGYTKCIRCAVASFTPTGGISQSRAGDYSMSSGVISFANTNANGPDPDQRVFLPGGNIFWAGTNRPSVGLFQAQAITQDATNVYIQTNEAGGFPSVTGIPIFETHPAPQFTCDSCTGDPILVATNIQRGATPLAPLGQFSSRDYAPTSAQGTLAGLFAFGKIVSLSINVTQAYSGSGSATLQTGGQFNNYKTTKQSDWSDFTFAPQINLKQAGERIITPSGVTCNGVSAPTGCSGDSLGTALPEAVWFGSNITTTFAPYMGSTLSAGTQPLFTMTLRTDQGVVP